MRTSPLQSLEETTPKPYIIWHHLNLQTQLQIQLEFRGLSAKLHYMHLEKGSNDQSIITMPLLVKNYPRIIYGMAIFEFGQNLIKTMKREGAKLQNYHPQLLEGPKCKTGLTMLIS